MMMMMKGVMMIHEPNNNQTILDNNNNNQENTSNVTSAASGEASVSSCNGGFYPPPQQQHQIKKKRNQPGNPDPGAEVVALSPKTLMATNRFVCEICNKGFQRDQNLQLHRRGHNLPWKLKQRSNKDVIRKKVYVCPEPTCVHHDPSRALGDLTGIKKHFSRKHGEKKWKCEKCSKRYAVQSDWKAHSKTCGTREYRCDCGTLFSRRDSFITHRAFCDALAEESARAITGNNNALPNNVKLHFAPPQTAPPPYIKREFSGGFNLRPEIPPWLLPCPTVPPPPAAAIFQEFQNPNPSAPFHHAPPHFSATALLQKAAEMGAKTSGPTAAGGHVTDAEFGLNLSSSSRANGFFNFQGGPGGVGAQTSGAPSHTLLLHDMISNSTFDDPLFGTISDDVTKDFLGLRPHIFNISNLVNESTASDSQSKKTWQEP